MSENVIDLDEWIAKRDEKAEAAAREATERADLLKFQALQDPTRGLLSVIEAAVDFACALAIRERGRGETLSELKSQKSGEGKKRTPLSKWDRDFLTWTDVLADRIAAARAAGDLAAHLPAEAARANVLQRMQATREAVAA